MWLFIINFSAAHYVYFPSCDSNLRCSSSETVNWILVIAMHIFTIFTVWSLVMVSFDPGYFVNNELESPLIGAPLSPKANMRLTGDQKVQYQKLTKMRYCYDWNCVKPPRAHHCTVCQRWVLRMDHHWNWISNCIGLKNHKFFLLFVFYYLLTNLWFLTLCILLLSKQGSYVITTLVIICIPVLLQLCRISIMQLLTFPFNLTTIERITHKKSPFDFGLDYNLKSIFGMTKLLWLIPVRQRLPTTGFYYRINIDKLVKKK